MKAYADTGFLVSVHSRDANTDGAIAKMKSQAFPIAWTWLHDLEFRNAIRLRLFRQQISAEEVAGVYLAAAPSWSEVARESERLSRIFTKTLGTRSLDVLHVSHALVLGVKEFLTFDTRQAALAKAAGLKVPKI